MSSVPFEIVRPDATQHLNLIIYGMTGAGKTYFCGTAGASEYAAPALVVDIEGGTLTLRELEPDPELVHVTRPADWQDLQDIYDYLRYDNDYYNSVFIDSLTEVQRKLSMGNILDELDESAEYEDLSKAIAPQRQDWLKTGEQMRKFIRAFRDLAYLKNKERRVHVVFTALEKYDEDKRVVAPELPGKLGTGCGALVDILGRMTKITREPEGGGEPQEHRFLLTQEHTDDRLVTYQAKNRGGRLGSGVWDPTVEDVIDVWMERDDTSEEDDQ